MNTPNYIDCPKCQITRKNTLDYFCSLEKENEDEFTTIYRCSVCKSTFIWKKKNHGTRKGTCVTYTIP